MISTVYIMLTRINCVAPDIWYDSVYLTSYLVIMNRVAGVRQVIWPFVHGIN